MTVFKLCAHREGALDSIQEKKFKGMSELETKRKFIRKGIMLHRDMVSSQSQGARLRNWVYIFSLRGTGLHH